MRQTETSRRTFVGGVALALGGFASTATVAGRGPPGDDPSIEFPDGEAFVGPDNPGPLEGAVQTENVFMPDGGWVVIQGDDDETIGDEIIGMSIRRRPAGRFRNLRVAVSALEEGEYDLRAVLFKGDDEPEEPYEDGTPLDTATITFPEPLSPGNRP